MAASGVIANPVLVDAGSVWYVSAVAEGPDEHDPANIARVFLRSIVADPSGPDDWVLVRVPSYATDGTDAESGLGIFGGVPVLAISGAILVATNAEPDDDTDWSLASPQILGRNPVLLGTCGRPAVFYYDAVQRSLGILRSIRVSLSDPNGWVDTVVDSEGDVGYGMEACELGEGYAVAYIDATNAKLKVAISDGTY